MHYRGQLAPGSLLHADRGSFSAPIDSRGRHARGGALELGRAGEARRLPAGIPYRKAGYAELLARIRPLVDARPSYGYRRITALLHRRAEAEGLARVNHKRVYRVMKRAGLLLAPRTAVVNARTMARSRPPLRTDAGLLTCSRSRAGTATRCVSRSPSTPTTARGPRLDR
jgi:hypothetical protein